MGKDVLVFSLLDWESKLLHRGHMLAKYFNKKGFSVYYVQKENIHISNFQGFKARTFKDGDITVISLPALPYMRGKVDFVYSLNDIILTGYLKELLKGLENPLIILESPYWSKAVRKSSDGEGIICYDISDDFPEFAENPKWRAHMLEYEEHALKTADLIFVTSEMLKDKVHNGEHAFLVENGVDLDEFKGSTGVLKTKFNSPICGFIGGLYQWIDFFLIEKLAIEYPDFTFVLIGPTDQTEQINKLAQYSNIHYLGEINRGEIGNYFASLDIGLIPFVSEEKYPRLKTVNSNKVFQYCYFGYPVLSTRFQQVIGLEDIIYVCSDREEFVERLGRCLKDDTEHLRYLRKEFAYENSWEKKVEDMLQIIRDNFPEWEE